jgi:hypothetical protein
MRITTVAVALALALPGIASAQASGSIAISAEQPDTSSAGWEKTIKKNSTSTLKGANDQWQMFFVAFLNKAAGSKEVNIVFYDEAEKKHEPTNAFPITTQPSAKILVSNVTFNAEQGFKAGHTYKVMVTRLIGGHEVQYAGSKVTLK